MERIEINGISVETVIAGTGPPLLFLHGGDYVAQNRAFLDRLARRFRVVAPRHPGFGTTPRPAWFRSVNDIAYLYLDLIDRLNLRDATLVGSSFGGWVALEIAVRSTARIGRLVLWGAQDGIVAPSYGEKLAAALPSARFESIPGAAHYPQIEHPEAVADHIARFVQENRP